MVDSHSLSKEKIRLAMLTFFLSQGLCFSTWASRIPDIKSSFGIAELALWGKLLFMIPLGKFVAIPIGGFLISRLGSRIMVQISILGYAVVLFFVGIISNLYILAGALFFFGIFWNLCDVSLNTQGINIERVFGRTIMASFHGGWSLAACLGAIVGFIMINLKVNPFFHFTIIALIIIINIFISRKYLQKDEIIQTDVSVESSSDEELSKKRKLLKPEKILILLGIVGFFALLIESAMFDWGALYFESIVKAPKSLQIGFLVFMVMMTVGRFLTHKAYTLWGKKRTVEIAGCLIFIGLFISGLFPNVYISSVGFMMVGVGISCMVPTIYSVVGEKTKMPVGMALTLLSCISLVGSLVAPLLIGIISQAFSLKYAYIIVSILGLLIVVMSIFSSVFIPTQKKENI